MKASEFNPTNVDVFWSCPHALRKAVLGYRGKILNSFTSFIRANETKCTAAIQRYFDVSFVGLTGISVATKTPPSKARKRKRSDDSDGKDGSPSPLSSDEDRMGFIEDVLIEAVVIDKKTNARSPTYLCTWQGYNTLDCNWVKESGMSREGKQWWSATRHSRYTGFIADDFPLFEECGTSLSLSPRALRFFLGIPPRMYTDAGLPPLLSKDLVTQHWVTIVLREDFNIGQVLQWLFVELQLQ